jgi:hypothetical protein
MIALLNGSNMTATNLSTRRMRLPRLRLRTQTGASPHTGGQFCPSGRSSATVLGPRRRARPRRSVPHSADHAAMGSARRRSNDARRLERVLRRGCRTCGNAVKGRDPVRAGRRRR